MHQTGLLAADPNCIEARGVALGLRRAFRMRLPAADVPRFRAVFTASGLHAAVSSQRFRPLEGGRLQVADAHEEALQLLVVADGPDLAEACLRDELHNATRSEGDDPRAIARTVAAHRRLGLAYGYPRCCVEAFNDAWLEAIWERARVVSDNALAILRAHRRSGTWHPWLRAFGGPLGQETGSPLRHLPCRFDCPDSIALAAALLADLQRSNPPQHRQCLRTPVGPLWVDAGGHVRAAPPRVARGGRADRSASDAIGATAGLAAHFPLCLPFGDSAIGG